MATVTNIVKHGKNGYQIFLDGLYHCTFTDETLVKSRIKIGDEVDLENLQNFQYENDKMTAFDKALNYLANIKSKKQVKDYLYQKGYHKNVVEETIDKLLSYHYLDDENFAKVYIRSYRLSKGKRLLRFELSTKGIADDIIQNCIEEIVDEQEAILSIANKYMKSKTADVKTIKKLYSYLLNKGFEFDDVKHVIQENFMIMED